MRERQVKVWWGTMESAPKVMSSYNLLIDMPFEAFAQSIQRQSPLRDAITAAWRRPETVCVPPLLDQASLPPPQTARARALATRLVEALRAKTPAGGVEGLIHEYALSSQEGVALMCLAEALLRIPDDATRDALIRDKIGGGDWRAHLGHSPSLFVNAATWGLVLTGRLTATSSERGLSAALTRLIARGGEPLIRTGVDHRHAPDGRAVRRRPDHRRGARRTAARWKQQGFRHSYDMLGEAAVTARRPSAIMQAYRAGDPRHRPAPPQRRGIYEGPGISIKLSALHPRYSRAQRERVQAELLAAPEGTGRAGTATTISASTSMPRKPTGWNSRSTCWSGFASTPSWQAGTASASSSRPIRSARSS